MAARMLLLRALDQVEEQLAGLRRLVVTTAAFAGLVALALAIYLARRFARPIQEVTEAAEKIATQSR